MRTIILFLLLVCTARFAPAQNDSPIVSRSILIGDAGEMDPAQKQVIQSASTYVIKGKTAVFFLGDNIYPNGMALPGTAEEKETQAILQSQYQPMREKGAKVYFLPGNHDWDRSGPQGLEKIRAQSAFIAAQGDQSLKMVPEQGCPDPQEIKINKDLTVIAFDSEWWVFTHEKTSSPACSCKTEEDVLQRFRQIFNDNRGKQILLASHHPFQSYGNHGGHYTFMQHLFPLRDINKNLYLPLPIIGSLYPLYRMLKPDKEDLIHPTYARMIKRIDSIFHGYPNLVHVAGHEHGLQFIEREGDLQVVSGSGAKLSHVVHGKYALFADVSPGYVIADQLADKSIRFTYFKIVDGRVVEAFKYVKPYI
jgi:hypothetical protein